MSECEIVIRILMRGPTWRVCLVGGVGVLGCGRRLCWYGGLRLRDRRNQKKRPDSKSWKCFHALAVKLHYRIAARGGQSIPWPSFPRSIHLDAQKECTDAL